MQKRDRINSWVYANWKKIWYMLCFLMLGIIDQRRGSAAGEVQMIFSNGTGLVIALLLVPSLKWRKIRSKVYLWWTPVCMIATFLACIVGEQYWNYMGQWISGVLNITVWSYLIIYVIREWRDLEIQKRWKQPFFWCIAVIYMLMQISRHEGLLGFWYFMIFGGFYFIGIPRENRKAFFKVC